jgi:phosphomevalonate kinase
MFFFGNEKSKIESECRGVISRVPYQVPNNLKQEITKKANDLKDFKLRKYEKKSAILKEQEREEKRVKENQKKEQDQLNQKYKREFDELKRRYERELDSLERSTRNDEDRLAREVNDAQKEIDTWQRNNKR